ncbi:similar to Saccharomyces cerevisiae YLR381W CTF3 Outer kinetochore protein that forms a complex with Mcm16p and Mcm22p [Maudiozyma saulgeensis]|uniref:Similar to Saccharomyces cerevisiae YLR381W CTF3 Outer kinetochore protein that forms a complex with Mcm16p and Mcm22p n=1 Tax=Maudiozyma saulgeensis TaxID=1789683 RepID=A0A1X7RB26_9SACH|nr:similar to Saccharomyces cerevisiae YLR381W CTF3 Outer kinetochore protein that forms a complex with Mcm16p and Mcm22p [Kazachstania saulgeensis]
MSNTLDTPLFDLIHATTDISQWELKALLKKVYSAVPRHGISPTMIAPFIDFLCTTQLITTSTKISLIEQYLIPNGYLGKDVVETLFKHLGTPTIYTQQTDKIPSKYIQVALCKWLVHVFFLLPESQDDSSLSTWLQIWQFDYLQEWITFIIVWSTRTRLDIKPWKVNLLIKVAKNTGYSNSRATATLILRKYLTVLNHSTKISDTLDEINCSESDIKDLQDLHWNFDFIKTLKIVLSRESSFKFNNSIVEDKLEVLISLLGTSDIDSRKLNFLGTMPNDKSILSETKTIVQLYKNWNYLKLPKNVELVITDQHYSLPQLFTLALSHLELSLENKAVEEFWIRMYSYLKIHLGRCFHEKQLTIKERMTLFDKIIHCCIIYSRFIPDIINDFLTLPNLFASKDLFIIICIRLLPIMPPPENYSKFKNKILKVLAICLLTKQKLDSKSDKGSSYKSTFGSICYSIVHMVQNWLLHTEDDTVMLYSLDLLGDIRKLLLSNMTNSLPDRNITLPTVLLLDVQSSFIEYYQNIRKPDERTVTVIDKVILKNNVMDKLLTLDDPLLLNHCCSYFIIANKFIKDSPAPNIYVQLYNQYIMDLTNYLWRSRVADSKKLFGIPTEFIKSIHENLVGGRNAELKLKYMFSVRGIPAITSVISFILRRIEQRKHCTVQYLYPITEDGFRRFQKELSIEDNSTNSWIPNVKTFNDLNILLLEELSSMKQYYFVVRFLTIYMKSLSHVQLLQ